MEGRTTGRPRSSPLHVWTPRVAAPDHALNVTIQPQSKREYLALGTQ